MPTKKQKPKSVKENKQIIKVNTKENKSGLAIASLVLGILGIFFNPLSILAIIFSIIALSKISRNRSIKGKSMAIAGLVLGIIGIIIWIISLVIIGTIFKALIQ